MDLAWLKPGAAPGDSVVTNEYEESLAGRYWILLFTFFVSASPITRCQSCKWIALVCLPLVVGKSGHAGTEEVRKEASSIEFCGINRKWWLHVPGTLTSPVLGLTLSRPSYRGACIWKTVRFGLSFVTFISSPAVRNEAGLACRAPHNNFRRCEVSAGLQGLSCHYGATC
jgi:hypothetical protein